MQITYSFDTTGQNQDNLITKELHTISDINSNNYRLIVPNFSPFYTDNLKLEYVDGFGARTILNEGVDYFLTLNYMAASRTIGKLLYGAVVLNTLKLSGRYEITYQTIGGEWVVDSAIVLNKIALYNFNPRISSWDTIVDKPYSFPTINHSLNIKDLKGVEDLINALGGIENAIYSLNKINDLVTKHIANDNNPHLLTAKDINLEKADNTSDKDKPASDATLALLRNKSDIGHTHSALELGIDKLMKDTSTGANQFVLDQLSKKSDIGHLHYCSEIVDLSSYPLITNKAELQYVNTMFQNVSTNYVSKLELDNKLTTVDQLSNFSKYATKDYVATQISNITGGTTGVYVTYSVYTADMNGKASVGHSHSLLSLGLSNVDNTSDLNKPISTATQNALDGKVSLIKYNADLTSTNNNFTAINTKLSNLAADTTLASTYATITLLNTKINDLTTTLSSGSATGGLTQTQVNAAIDAKITGLFPITEINSGGQYSGVWKAGFTLLTSNGTIQTPFKTYSDVYIDAIKNGMVEKQNSFQSRQASGYGYTTHWTTWINDNNGYNSDVPSKRYLEDLVTAEAAARTAITKTTIGLSNVDNTSDLNKPISTATQAALNVKLDTNAYSSNYIDLINKLKSAEVLTSAGGANLLAKNADVTTALAAKADLTYVNSKITSAATSSLKVGYVWEQNSTYSGYGFMILKTTDAETSNNCIVTPSDTIGRFVYLVFRNSSSSYSATVNLKVNLTIAGAAQTQTNRICAVPPGNSFAPAFFYLPPGSTAWIKSADTVTDPILFAVGALGCY